MKTVLLSICLFASIVGMAQLTVSPSLEFIGTPTFGGGKLLRPILLYNSSGTVISPGLKIQDCFLHDKTNSAALCLSSGFYYYKNNVVAVETDDKDEFYSELNYEYVNVPLMARAEVAFNPLIESNKINLELGFQNSLWMNYKLKEIASIKSYDTNGDLVGETIYQDDNKLISKFAGKYTLSIVTGMGISFKRFDIMARYTFSLSDFYTVRPAGSQVPANYSLYEHEHNLGRLKQQYFSAALSYRLVGK